MPPDDLWLPDAESIAYDHHRMVERVIAAMRSADETLTLNDLAEIAGLSPFYFTRLFRDLTGIPPGEFRNAVRFERAKELLMTSPASVTEICFEVGYQSLGTFSSRFKALVGVTPAEFRSLPDIMGEIDFTDEITRWDPERFTTAKITGSTTLPEGVSANIYVGLFSARFAATRPVAGTMVPDDRPYVMHQVPPGDWVLLAAAIPQSTDMLNHLVPRSGVLLANGGEVSITHTNEVIVRDLVFREPNPLDAPVLIALPALLL